MAFAKLTSEAVFTYGDADHACACAALGAWAGGGARALETVLRDAPLLDAWLVERTQSKRRQAALLASFATALAGADAGADALWEAFGLRGGAALLAKRVRDGDDTVKKAALAACATAIRAASDALPGLLAVDGFYEFLEAPCDHPDADVKRAKFAVLQAAAASAEARGQLNAGTRSRLAFLAASGAFYRGGVEARPPQVCTE